MAAITASELRRNVYRLLDQVLETGEELEVTRNGRRIRISAVPQPSKLDNLVPHPDYIVGDSNDLVHIDWSSEWHPDPQLS